MLHNKYYQNQNIKWRDNSIEVEDYLSIADVALEFLKGKI